MAREPIGSFLKGCASHTGGKLEQTRLSKIKSHDGES